MAADGAIHGVFGAGNEPNDPSFAPRLPKKASRRPTLALFDLDAYDVAHHISQTENLRVKGLMESIVLAARKEPGTTMFARYSRLGANILISLALVMPSVLDPLSECLTEFDFHVTTAVVAVAETVKPWPDERYLLWPRQSLSPRRVSERCSPYLQTYVSES
ncbi:hypothetical protein FA95DRAFT_630900 [Auriscalpium vulgare]|uniref:Uncharacterized protein n=1 Tax=Auriscalpium vulgare TaxID=40419 RepID=A0ACB8RDH6_9AGAM|nr:hypothetical protein FA95DRAFT_630900 [Auriscalpium vulgare]